MRTPAGKECRHYYQDFHRGRNIQECRLIKYNPESRRWHPSDCAKCPVPDILNANANPNLELKLTIKARFLGFGRYPEVEAFCHGKQIPLEDAYTGCTDLEENKGLDLFRQALEQIDDND
jgi:hypothetical protein